ncbi:HK97 family phage prohead protease [Bacillus pseudomycoides]|uniref:HK97 family phage prohead protease n=1 Tax=Bacillus pseudomycoides TaxID=64104 RepID=UPI002FFE8D56
MADKPEIKDENEIRTVYIRNLETREKGSQGTKVTGYAAVYDEFTALSDWWGETFFERIDKNALKNTLADGHDIFALKNHNWDDVIGRTGANLNLENHENGLYFELSAPNTTLGRDVLEEVRSGLISGCSIGFKVKDQNWEEKDGDWFRTITDIELHEITLTPIPAYAQTSVEVRSLTIKPDNKSVKIDVNQTNLEQEERNAILAEANEIYKSMKKQGGK